MDQTEQHKISSGLAMIPTKTENDLGDQMEIEKFTTQLPMTRRSIIKNLIVLSAAFMLLFTAYKSSENLQSSLNKEEGLGTISIAVLYASAMATGLFLPPLVINRLGCKWTLAASMVCYIVFMAANLHAVWGTMIPASVIIGIGAAPLWVSKCIYLNQLAVWYSKITNTSKEGTIGAFVGIFFMSYQSCQIWGNLISSLIFSQHVPDGVNVTSAVLDRCGANYCPIDFKNNSNLDRPNMTKIYTVCGIYLGCACLALLAIVLTLDQIDLDTDDDQPKSTLALLKSIAKHLYNSKNQKLLIPLSIYNGIEQAFISGEFTRSFISCSTGVWNVGFVMIAYGVVDASASIIIGRLVKFTSFAPWFFLAFVVHAGSLITFLLWTPSADRIVLLYVFAVLWGIGDAVIQPLNDALYGCLFANNPEPAFACCRLFEYTGFVFVFSYSSYVCTDIKIYICLAFLTIGMTLYGVMEVLQRRNR